jgi:hypothetical protein
MFNAKQIKTMLEAQPFQPFRLHMTNGKTYDIPNHDAAWVLAGAVEVGLNPDAEGFATLVNRCAILHIASIEDLKAA